MKLLFMLMQSLYFSLVIFGALFTVLFKTPLGALVFMALSNLGMDIQIEL